MKNKRKIQLMTILSLMHRPVSTPTGSCNTTLACSHCHFQMGAAGEPITPVRANTTVTSLRCLSIDRLSVPQPTGDQAAVLSICISACDFSHQHLHGRNPYGCQTYLYATENVEITFLETVDIRNN